MEFKGTPGPWFCMNGTDVFTGLNSINASGIKSDKTDGWQIADCSVGKTFVDGEYVELSTSEQIANARLIAAAPELLSVLQGIQKSLAKYIDIANNIGVDVTADGFYLGQKARTAINKALGGDK